MQTFLPFSQFNRSAKCLDRLRLGKQRVEAWQILQVLEKKIHHRDNPTIIRNPGWANHPAVLMWEGYMPALCAYGITICQEWIRRGYRDSMLQRFQVLPSLLSSQSKDSPPWLGWQKFHRSHQAALLHKDRAHYNAWFPFVEWTGYVWPTPASTDGSSSRLLSTARVVTTFGTATTKSRRPARSVRR